MAADLDTRFQTAIADDLPSFLVNPTGELEESEAVAGDLAAVSAHGGGAEEAGAGRARPGPATCRGSAQAPDFTGTQSWFNTDGEALTMEELRGQVVLIDFWTYTCINCIRTLPVPEGLGREYRDDGLTIVGVHSPEFPFEKDAGNVADAIEQNGIDYPVVQDNDFGTWDAFGNQYWPAKYLIDAEGQVRYVHFGEGEYDETEQAIRTLLREKGDDELGGGRPGRRPRPPHRGRPRPRPTSARPAAEGWVNGADPHRHPGLRRPATGAAAAPTSSPSAAAGRSTPRARRPRATRRIDAELRRREGLPRARLARRRRARSRCCSTAGRSRPRSPARTSAAGVVTVARAAPLPPGGPARRRAATGSSSRFEPGITGYAFTFG